MIEVQVSCNWLKRWKKLTIQNSWNQPFFSTGFFTSSSSSLEDSSSDDDSSFLAGVFLAGVFLAGVFFAGVFFAGAAAGLAAVDRKYKFHFHTDLAKPGVRLVNEFTLQKT